ncbi:MAG: NTP transferase domain-containing protein [Gammaproteobacteria bacterium]|nr:NTP transferase domain-containing protein [Gammaproteobacteria bacterium]
MKAIIMAAGIGSRLLEINNHKPKCLITTGKETLISRMIRLLHQHHVHDITVITGYKNHLIHQELGEKVHGIVKSEVRQSHSIFLRMFFENIQPVTRHYGAPWGAY